MAKQCKLCGGTDMDQRLEAHALCTARKELGLPVERLPDSVPVEAKVINGQLFERRNGQWVKVMDTVIFR